MFSHTTGLPTWRWINNPDKKLNLQFSPSAKYSYSGEGIMLSQWVVGHVTEKDLEDLANEMIFKPLQMNHTDYLWRNEFKEHFCYGHSVEQKKLPKDIETEDAAAAGSMKTALIDYSKFLEHILKLYSEDSDITKTLFHLNIRIKSKVQFAPLSNETTSENDI